jgi:hypothetical protein
MHRLQGARGRGVHCTRRTPPGHVPSLTIDGTDMGKREVRLTA